MKQLKSSLYVIIIMVTFIFTGCTNSNEESNMSITDMKNELEELKKEVEEYKLKIDSLNAEVTNLNNSLSKIKITLGIKNEQTNITEESILNFAIEALQTIKNRDFEKLNDYIDDKMFLSPNAYPSFGEYENYIYKGEAELISSSNEKIIWGYQQGSGEVIELTPKELIEQYIYKEDYINAPQISVNKIIKSSYGEEEDLVMQNIYYDHFVEFHFPGFDSQYEGLDWTSLRMLIKQDENGYLYITAIYIDNWTI